MSTLLSLSTLNGLGDLNNSLKRIDFVNAQLSTGLDAPTAYDDPVTFFTNQGLQKRNSDLKQTLSDINLKLSAVQSAIDGQNQIKRHARSVEVGRQASSGLAERL